MVLTVRDASETLGGGSGALGHPRRWSGASLGRPAKLVLSNRLVYWTLLNTAFCKNLKFSKMFDADSMKNYCLKIHPMLNFGKSKQKSTKFCSKIARLIDIARIARTILNRWTVWPVYPASVPSVACFELLSNTFPQQSFLLFLGHAPNTLGRSNPKR